jgi:hypothetical protein
MLDLSTFVIIIGFRFHLALILPFFFIVTGLKAVEFKNAFKDPPYKRNYPFLLSLFITTGIIFLVFYILQFITPGDPEYFYELGLSSLVDLPVYFIWNSINLILFFFFLTFAADRIGHNIILIALLIASLFIYEFIPLGGEETDIIGIINVVFTSVLIAILITRFRNIYWFTLFIYLLLWIFILLFGSSYPPLIRMIYASQYSSWEGFFIIETLFRSYSYLLYVFFITLTLFFLSFKKKTDKIIS